MTEEHKAFIECLNELKSVRHKLLSLKWEIYSSHEIVSVHYAEIDVVYQDVEKSCKTLSKIWVSLPFEKED